MQYNRACGPALYVFVGNKSFLRNRAVCLNIIRKEFRRLTHKRLEFIVAPERRILDIKCSGYKLAAVKFLYISRKQSVNEYFDQSVWKPKHLNDLCYSSCIVKILESRLFYFFIYLRDKKYELVFSTELFTAAMVDSLPASIGNIMYGNTTISFSGSTGSVSGISELNS